MRKVAILSALACICAIRLWAVPADPTLQHITLPDGTTKEVRLVGDEHFSYYTTPSGTPLRRLESGYFVEDPSIANEAANVRGIRRAQQQTEGAGDHSFPGKGSPHSLVLLVGFKDLPFAQKRADFENLLNQSGYNYNNATGSYRDYYIASSDSIFQPIFDVFGPYTASENMDYYGKQEGSTHDKNPGRLIAEACQMAHDDGVDFSKYDTNGDGILDNVFVYYAGHNQAEGAATNTIWPHQSSIANLSVKLDGVTCASYACTSEYRGAGGSTRCGIGTFCHEFGHVIGQPDFYDTDYKYYSVGDWDVMCSGSYNNQGRTPPTFTAYERFYMGWLTPTQLTTPGRYTLPALNKSGEAYLIAAQQSNLNGTQPSPSEFFMLEYRDGTGSDAYLPGHGMLVFHIDYSSAAWSQNRPNNGPDIMRMHLEEANGITWKQRSNGEGGRSSDPYPGTKNVTSFNPLLHSGVSLGTPVFDISEKNGYIEFIYIGDGSTSLLSDKTEIALVTTVDDDKKTVDWAPQDFNLVGSSLAPDKAVEIKAGGNFLLYAGESYPTRANSQWKGSLSINPEADSTFNQKIWLSFRPTRQNCEMVSQSITIKADGAILSLLATGQAPRPTYVKTPVAAPVSAITPYSFDITWNHVNDAEAYYLTLYSIQDTVSVQTQGFEKFADPAAVTMQGWQSTTNLTTTSAKADGNVALYLKQTGDQITSELYPTSLNAISYWLNAFTSDRDTVGYLTTEAFDGQQWVELGETYITTKTKKKTVSQELQQDANYRRIRITYHDMGGSGVALDAFKATLRQKINYIYRGSDQKIDVFPVDKPIVFHADSLQPNQTYYYQLQCSDGQKGCEEHLTALSEAVAVTTQDGEPVDSKYLTLGMDSINYDRPTHTIYLLTPHTGDKLCVYSPTGAVMYSADVAEGVYYYPLPVSGFISGNVYIVRHQPATRAYKKQQKQRWVKFFY